MTLILAIATVIFFLIGSIYFLNERPHEPHIQKINITDLSEAEIALLIYRAIRSGTLLDENNYPIHMKRKAAKELSKNEAHRIFLEITEEKNRK